MLPMQCYCLMAMCWFPRLRLMTAFYFFLVSYILQNSNDTWCGRFAQQIVSLDSDICLSVSYSVYCGFHRLFFRSSQTSGMANFSSSAKLNNTVAMVKNVTISTTLLKGFSAPILPSCELYSFLVVYICTFCLFDCLRVVVVFGGNALMYIVPSIRFELDFYRTLCRVFCFGEILPVVRDFCSLSLVSGKYILFHLLLAAKFAVSRGGNNYCCHFHFGCRNRSRSAESHVDTSHSACLTSLWTALPPGEYALIVKSLYLNSVGLLLPAVWPTALPPPCPAALYHTLYVEREINILCLMPSVIVFISSRIYWGQIKCTCSYVF